MAKPPQKPILATQHSVQFACAGPACPDTCCAGWVIEVDEPTRRKYDSKRDLKDVYGPSHVVDHAMLCGGKNNTCLQHTNGWCGIQQRYGEDYLSESCYFFPRTYRLLGKQRLAGASLACPEAARTTLFTDVGFAREDYALPREINNLPNRLLPEVDEQTALQIHGLVQTSMEDTSLSAEQHLARLVKACHALKEIESSQWHDILASCLHAPPPAPANEKHDYDDLRLLHGVFNIAVADNSQYRDRLYQTLRDMEKALEAPLHWLEGSLDFTPETLPANLAAHENWQKHAPRYAPMLHRWLAAYVANWAFPFAGSGKHPWDNAYMLVIQFATVRLALICACKRAERDLSEDEIIRVVQSIARLYDHITDVRILFDAFSFEGWHDEKRLCSLFGG